MPTTTTALPELSPAVAVEAPTTFRPYRVGGDVTVIPSYLPVPGFGTLPANAFLLDGDEPVLVDTGPGGTADGFRAALESVIDPADIRWLWLTHTDPDHIGSLAWLLDAAPSMRVVTTYLAVGKLAMHQPLPMDRLRWANPGDTVDVGGGRRLLAVRPPSYDAPETVACFDAATGTLFSADTFGALLSAPAEQATDVNPAELAEGLILWGTIDAPWVADVDRSRFDARCAALASLSPSRVLGAHLPPAEGQLDTLLDLLQHVPDANPWVGPDQGALDAILGQVTS